MPESLGLRWRITNWRRRFLEKEPEEPERMIDVAQNTMRCFRITSPIHDSETAAKAVPAPFPRPPTRDGSRPSTRNGSRPSTRNGSRPPSQEKLGLGITITTAKPKLVLQTDFPKRSDSLKSSTSLRSIDSLGRSSGLNRTDSQKTINGDNNPKPLAHTPVGKFPTRKASLLYRTRHSPASEASPQSAGTIKRKPLPGLPGSPVLDTSSVSDASPVSSTSLQSSNTMKRKLGLPGSPRPSLPSSPKPTVSAIERIHESQASSRSSSPLASVHHQSDSWSSDNSSYFDSPAQSSMSSLHPRDGFQSTLYSPASTAPTTPATPNTPASGMLTRTNSQNAYGHTKSIASLLFDQEIKVITKQQASDLFARYANGFNGTPRPSPSSPHPLSGTHHQQMQNLQRSNSYVPPRPVGLQVAQLVLLPVSFGSGVNGGITPLWLRNFKSTIFNLMLFEHELILHLEKVVVEYGCVVTYVMTPTSREVGTMYSRGHYETFLRDPAQMQKHKAEFTSCLWINCGEMERPGVEEAVKKWRDWYGDESVRIEFSSFQ